VNELRDTHQLTTMASEDVNRTIELEQLEDVLVQAREER